MIDILNFLFSQFGNIISFLDNFEIIENLSLLRIFIILFIFRFAIKFLFPHKGGEH